MCLLLLYTTTERHNYVSIVAIHNKREIIIMCLLLLYTTTENHNYVSIVAIHNNRES